MQDLCYELHSLFNSLPRYNFNTIDDIPFSNGIYIFFEKNEFYKGFDRIVRVGTDTGQNNLKSRMKQHLVNENKDRSIFRKNIGRAILNKNKNFELLSYWNLDLTKREDKDKYFNTELNTQCKLLEKEISIYMQNNFSFVVFNVEKKEDRLRLESAIISILNKCEDFIASDMWLGNFIPEIKGNHIKDCRMWLSQGLKATPLTNDEFLILKKICKE